MWGLDASTAITGVAAASSTGVLAESGDANFTLTGLAAASATGTLSETGDSLTSITGIAAASTTGTLSESGTANLALPGQDIVTASGTVTAAGDPVNGLVSLTGLDLVISVGTLDAAAQNPTVGGGFWRGIGPYTLPHDGQITLQGIGLKIRAGKLRPHADISDEELLILLALIA